MCACVRACVCVLYVLGVCVCVCVMCVYVRARACVCVCVCTRALMYCYYSIHDIRHDDDVITFIKTQIKWGIAVTPVYRHSAIQDTTPKTHFGNHPACHKPYYVIQHCTNNTCSHSSKLQLVHSRKQLPPIQSQTFLHFIPSLIVPASPSPAVACCVYLHACRLCVRMAARMAGNTSSVYQQAAHTTYQPASPNARNS